MAPATLTADGFKRAQRHAERSLAEMHNSVTSLDPRNLPSKHELSVLLNELNAVQEIILDDIRPYLISDELPREVTENMVSDTYYNLTSQCRKLRASLVTLLNEQAPRLSLPVGQSTMIAGPSQADPNATVNLSVSLPKFKLPEFNGNVAEFDHFWSRFDVLINKSSALSTLEKFEYLLGQLTGPASDVLKHLTFSEANYPIAIDLLKKRFSNPRRAISLHATEILNLPQVSNSVNSIRHYLDLYNVHFNAVKNSGDKNPAEVVFTQFLLSRFTPDLRDKFESALRSEEFPTANDLIAFLNKQVAILENAGTPSFSNLPSVQRGDTLRKLKLNKSKPVSKPFYSSLTASANSTSCPVCKLEHAIHNCKLFLAKSPFERFKLLKSKHMCLKCLTQHTSKCKSKNVCQTCQSDKHHSLLHFMKQSPTGSVQNSNPGLVTVNSENKSSVSESHPTCLSVRHIGPTSVLMATALVRLQITKSRYIIVRGLLDSASEISAVSEKVVQQLGCGRNSDTLTVSGVGNCRTSSRGMCSFDVTTLSGQVIKDKHPFVIMSSITQNTPKCNISDRVKLAAQKLILADPTFDITSPVDILLGADITAECLLGNVVPLGEGLPLAVSTVFGYVLIGQAPTAPPNNFSKLKNIYNGHKVSRESNVDSFFTSIEEDSLHALMEKFWSADEVPSKTEIKSIDDQVANDYFVLTTTRLPSGRYQVRLPFKNINKDNLLSNHGLASKRMQILERKFESNPKFKDLYVAEMRDYIARGHMIPVADSSFPKFYIPHFAVVKTHGDKSKIRVVFDSSSCVAPGSSLNDFLYTGPKLQPIISDILTLFRYYKVVFTCDIEQMYRQILLHPDDMPFQCILWRENVNEPMQIYALSVVIFGNSVSPFLALKTLQQLACDEEHAHPLAAKVVRSSTFVDDIIAGGDNVDDALQVKADLIAMLGKGGFELKKWYSNHHSLIQDVYLSPKSCFNSFNNSMSIPNCNKLNFNSNDLKNNSSVSLPISARILGIQWNLNTDTLHYPSDYISPADSFTKRAALAQVARLYDPCGFIAPIIMAGKCLIQDIWKASLSWDSPLPPPLDKRLKNFISHLPSLSEVSMPRILVGGCHRVQLHGFSDASSKGISAVIYMRAVDPPFHTSLVASRTRVAPTSPVSIPRLELMAASLLAKLIDHLYSVLSNFFSIERVWLWTDSTIILHWINTDPNNLKIFVANRVVKLLEVSTTSQWRHVPGIENPADIASRGCTPEELIRSHSWWFGPEWLAYNEAHWPTILELGRAPESASLELKKSVVISCTTSNLHNLFERISSWSLLMRVASLIAKWVFIGRHKSFTPLQLKERGHIYIMKYIQANSLKTEIDAVAKGHRTTLAIQRLAPFIDVDGVLRARGRLSHAEHLTQKFPIILPKRHYFVKLLIMHTHLKFEHAGSSQVQYHLSLSYWILSARQVIRSVIFSCVPCFRIRPKDTPPLMADLPSDRVNPSPPFSVVGIDYCGPFHVKSTHLRKAPLIKIYICVFICLVTKAIHLEVAYDMTTDAFIDALKRCISRRGCPKRVYSDCGTNFVCGNKLLQINFKTICDSPEGSNLIKKYAFDNNIEFLFNPPGAPHQGGLWERAVQSTKYHLKRVVGLNVYTAAQFNSIVINIESILNSRPLTLLPSQPEDVEVLTPGHFLIGRPLTCPPDSEVSFSGVNLGKHYQAYKSVLQQFWKKWKLEYLTTLHARSKWYTKTPNLRVDDVVILEDPHDPPLHWPTGRITKVFPGSDGTVRSAEVTTSAGTYVRPATKLFRIPADGMEY